MPAQMRGAERMKIEHREGDRGKQQTFDERAAAAMPARRRLPG
jgi:hypothetical protein